MPAIQLVQNAAKIETVPVSKTEAKLNRPEGMQSAFSNYMQQSSFHGAQMAKQQSVSTLSMKEQPKASGSSVQQDYAQNQPKAAAQADKLTNTAVDGTAQGADDDGAAEISGAVNDAIEAVKGIVKEELGVSDEQLEAAMELLGLTQADLLQPQQLTALAVELTGSQDAGMLLFSEGFQSMMQQVSVITEDLLQNLGMTMEQLMDQVNKMEGAGQLDMTDIPVQTESPAVEQPDNRQTADIPTAEQPVQAEEVQTVQPADHTQTMETTETISEPRQQTEENQPVQESREQIQEQPVEDVQEQAGEQQPVQQKAGIKEDTQEGQGEPGFSDDAQPGSRNMQQDSRPSFEFHADVRQGQPLDTPVTNNTANQAPLPQINVDDVIRQITEYTRIHLTENVKTIEMQLNPANLGKIFLHVTEKAGTITAQLTAQDENVKEALIQQAAVLKDNLNQQGIKVNAVEVSVGTHEFESNLEKDARQQEEQARQQEEQNSRRSRRGINLDELSDLDGLSGLMSEEEMLAAQIMKDHGNKVDFKA